MKVTDLKIVEDSTFFILECSEKEIETLVQIGLDVSMDIVKDVIGEDD